MLQEIDHHKQQLSLATQSLQAEKEKNERNVGLSNELQRARDEYAQLMAREEISKNTVQGLQKDGEGLRHQLSQAN